MDQFEIRIKRVSYTPFISSKSRSIKSSKHLVSANVAAGLSHLHIFNDRIEVDKRKTSLEKFQELRRRLATKTNERVRKATIRSVSKEDGVPDAKTQDSLNRSGLFCSRVVMHMDRQRQEETWKKGLAGSNELIRNKSKQGLDLSQMTTILPIQHRKIS